MARPTPLVVFATAGGGVDSLAFDDETEVYILHVGSGIAAAARGRGERRLTVPAELAERLAFLAACMLEHDGVL